jgi:16S rRNA (cytosine967-C5)-methyltransferase
MTPAARICAVQELYDMVLNTPKPTDQVVQTYFRGRKYIGAKDRRYIAEMIYDVLRHYARLNWWADRLDMRHTGRLALLIWYVLHENWPIQNMQELFSGQKHTMDELTIGEVDLIHHLQTHVFEPAEMPDHVRHECPEWAYSGLQQNFGTQVTNELQAMQVGAPLDIRVNTLKENRDSVYKRLQQDGMDVALTPFSPQGLRIQGRPAFSMHPLYQDGKIEVQDEGSQLLGLLCGVVSGEWVVDFCAGAGGKTMALAAQLQNKGRIYACDIDERRLENARKRLRRSGVHCVETKVLSDQNDPWVKKHKEMVDCVLIDAPCSGMGTWRRNPFSRWQNLGPSLSELVPLQASILDSAARLVKSGGRLIYATCSMLPQENQNQVAQFLAAHPEFTPIPLQELWQRSGLDTPMGLDLSTHQLQLTPQQHHTDGFYVAALRRG